MMTRLNVNYNTGRKVICGITFVSVRRTKGRNGNWKTENGRVAIRKTETGRAWSVYLDGTLIGNNQLTNLAECVQANEWAIRRGL